MFVSLFSKKKKKPKAPEPAAITSTEPITMTSDSLTFLVGFTTRRAIERRMGPAVEYPAPGWKTWAAAGLRGETWILSAIYRGQVLIGIEHYLAKTENLPRFTPPANGIFKLQPGNIGIGTAVTKLGDRFVSAAGKEGGPRSLVYQHAYQARWPHGVAIISGNDGRVERMALYANHEMPTLPVAPAPPPDPGDRLVN
jgi:hypothetical protein